MKTKVKIAFLGGVDEFGENLTCYYDGTDGFMVDFGAMFPDYYHHGVTYFYPDYKFITDNYQKFKVLFVTHGHEDHIGGIVNIVDRIPLRIIASEYTIALIKRKLMFSKVKFYPVLEVAENLSEYSVGKFKIKFIENDHSIIDSYSLKITYDNDYFIFHSSDFKIDKKSEKTNNFLDALKENFKKTDIALVDSTNATVDYDINLSETNVKNSLEDIIEKARHNVFVTMFSSNIERIINLINIVEKFKKPLVFLGRSLDKYTKLAEDINIRISKKNIISSMEYNDFLEKDENFNAVFLIAGSQGELTSALTNIAYNQYKGVFVNEGDIVVYSSKAIPGNEKDILKVKNQLLKKGTTLITLNNDDNIHASGHSNADGLREIIKILKPDNLIPVHGTLMQQNALKKIALQENVKNIMIPSLGDIFSYDGEKLNHEKTIELSKKFLDITGFDDMDYSLIKERDKLKLGICAISLIIDKRDYFLLKNPKVELRGFVDDNHLNLIIEKAIGEIYRIIDDMDLSSEEYFREVLILKMKRFFRKRYNISPYFILLTDYV